MNRRLALLLIIALLLASCASNKTMLRFHNETECGTATLELTNGETGHIATYAVDQGSEIEIEVDPNIAYAYKVTYPRQPNFIVCEEKNVTTMLSKGKTVNVRLESQLSPELQTATPAS